MRRTLVVVAVVAAASTVVAGCGKASPPARALSATTSHLSDIHSGRLTMSLLGSSAAGSEASGGAEGFRLEGPFSVATKKGQLPVADLEFTRIVGGSEQHTRFTSTGSAAFLRIQSGVYRLPDARVADLRARGKAGNGAGLAGLDLNKWVSHPTMRAAGSLDGMPVVRISGRLDPVRALNDMLSVASGLGASDPGSPTHLTGSAADRVRKAVRSSNVEIITGRDDHLLRELRVTIGLEVNARERLRTALGRLAGVQLSMHLAVAAPNRPIRVVAPANARPASEIPTTTSQ
jgi:hypothetical protein